MKNLRRHRVASLRRRTAGGQPDFYLEPGMHVRRLERRGPSADTGIVMYVDEKANRVAVQWVYGIDQEDPELLIRADNYRLGHHTAN